MKQIENFLKKLRRVKHTETVFNPYRQRAAVANLRAYLNLVLNQSAEIKMLVGEAPGYLGCRITGIPFSSGELLLNTNHPTLRKIKTDLTIKQIESEATANYVWNYLRDKETIPLFWNSFPFHPHFEGKPNTNRAPTAKEIEQGKEYLTDLYEIFQPSHVASIGRKGERALQQAFPDKAIIYIRHPSYGGKSDFLKGMDDFL